MVHVYTPLRKEKQEIRLFDLDPWTVDNSDPIELRMVTTELGHAGDYVCLSYTWGKPVPKYGIKVDGCDFEIRKNLHAALLCLRRRDRPRRLWVDAICINQEDVAERDAQVSIMQRIYHSATEVIAWIGEDNGAGDERAIKFLYQLRSRAQDYFGFGLFGEEPVNSSSGASGRLDKETLDWIESVTPLGLADSIWLDFTALLSRPWFSRIWIVQEVVMGRSVTVQCGRHQLKWMDICLCALFVNKHANVIMQIAAPQCLKSHDLGRCEFFLQSKPGYHLLRATENISRIGYLLFRRQFQRTILDIARPAVNTYLNSAQTRNKQLGHLWGWWSPNLRKFCLVELAPVSSNKASQQSSSSPNLDPPLEDPRFVNQYLPDSESVEQLAVWVDGKIPIYTTRGPASTNGGSRWSLWTLVNNFRAFGASNLRDKVYALVGLAAEVELIASLPSISYQVSVFEAFWALIAAELRGGGKLCFLSDACGLDRPEGFPS